MIKPTVLRLDENYSVLLKNQADPPHDNLVLYCNKSRNSTEYTSHTTLSFNILEPTILHFNSKLVLAKAVLCGNRVPSCRH